jgi:hypothetical protein|tara:strand:+ start:137 stop:733 length:597 start_codon:yes stop_codon:yes gene_type:complete
MLNQIDTILFPDTCEVLEVAPQRFVYPIHKNGSTSLHNSGFRSLSLDEIQQLDVIEVLVRNPTERYISGVSKFIEDTELDDYTVLHFVENYLFLNNHYAPQLYWLLNLQRFTNAKMLLSPMSQLATITKLHDNTSDKNNLVSTNDKVEFYLQLDQVLIGELLGRTVTFKQVVQTVKHRYPEVYKEVIQRSIDLCNVLV